VTHCLLCEKRRVDLFQVREQRFSQPLWPPSSCSFIRSLEPVRQPVLSLEVSLHSRLCCPLTCLFTAACAASGRVCPTPVLPLDVSVLQQPVLSLDVSLHSSLCCLWTCLFTAACAAHGRVSSQQSVLPHGRVSSQQPVLPLDVFLHNSLCYPWKCLLNSSQQPVLPWMCLFSAACAAPGRVSSQQPVLPLDESLQELSGLKQVLNGNSCTTDPHQKAAIGQTRQETAQADNIGSWRTNTSRGSTVFCRTDLFSSSIGCNVGHTHPEAAQSSVEQTCSAAA
jgi:hypothetical protein